MQDNWDARDGVKKPKSGSAPLQVRSDPESRLCLRRRRSTKDPSADIDKMIGIWLFRLPAARVLYCFTQ
jgi:hypothetical protein